MSDLTFLTWMSRRIHTLIFMEKLTKTPSVLMKHSTSGKDKADQKKKKLKKLYR